MSTLLKLAATVLTGILSTGRHVVSEVIHQGTTAVVEGFGKTVDYFDQKHRHQALRDVRGLEITVRSAAPGHSEKEGAARSVELVIDNLSDREIAFDAVLSADLILAEDADGVSYKPERKADGPFDTLPARSKTMHTATFVLPADAKMKSIRYGDRRAAVPGESEK